MTARSSPPAGSSMPIEPRIAAGDAAARHEVAAGLEQEVGRRRPRRARRAAQRSARPLPIPPRSTGRGRTSGRAGRARSTTRRGGPRAGSWRPAPGRRARDSRGDRGPRGRAGRTARRHPPRAVRRDERVSQPSATAGTTIAAPGDRLSAVSSLVSRNRDMACLGRLERSDHSVPAREPPLRGIARAAPIVSRSGDPIARPSNRTSRARPAADVARRSAARRAGRRAGLRPGRRPDHDLRRDRAAG